MGKIWTPISIFQATKVRQKLTRIGTPTEMVKTKDFFREHWTSHVLGACHNFGFSSFFSEFLVRWPKQTNISTWGHKTINLEQKPLKQFLNAYKWSYKRLGEKTASLLVFCPCQKIFKAVPVPSVKVNARKIHEFWHQFFFWSWTVCVVFSIQKSIIHAGKFLKS